MPDTAAPREPPRRIDLRTVIDTVRAGRATEAWLARWLPSTHEAPEAFRENLYAHAAARRGGLAGSAEGPFDFYRDCVLAHQGTRKRAFAGREGGADVELTYEALHARSGALASAWQGAGVAAGKSVCLLMDVSVDYVVALVTALRLGLVVSAVPPLGPTFARNRVAALKADAIVAGERHRPWLEDPKALFLPSRGGREIGAHESSAYAAKKPVLRLFCPFQTGELEPLDVDAAGLHFALLRDALVVFALDGDDTLAAPGFDPLACQPTSLLAALLAGACFAEIPGREAAANPDLLARQKVTVLGVGAALREAMLAREKWPVSGVRAWFRDLTHPIDFERNDALGRLSAKEGVASFNTVLSAATGGALLFGPVVPEPPGLRAWPPPGGTWQLSEVAAGALPALGTAGVYTPLEGEEPAEGGPRMLLARSGDGYLCTGSMDVGPGARAYPIDEVSAVAETHPAVRRATVVVTPGRGMNEAAVTLIAFVEAPRGPDGLPRSGVDFSELRALVTREMGEWVSPSRIEAFPLWPRHKEGRVDRGWCRSQYLGGALTAKARDEVFLLLGRMGDILHERAPGA